MRKAVLSIIVFFGLSLPGLSKKNTIDPVSGPTSVQEGTTHSYTYTGSIAIPRWEVNGGGTLVSESHSGNFHQVSIRWQSSGNVKLYSGFAALVAQTNVAVIPPPTPPMPNTPINISYNCGNTSLSYSRSPPSGVEWHWQTIASGTTRNSFTSSFTRTISSQQNVYLRAYRPSSGLWSTESLEMPSVPVNHIPGLSSGSNKTRCGTGAVTLTASPGSNGNTIRWYSASSGGTLLHTGTSYTTPSLSSNRTYYAASYNSSTECMDNDRKAITAIVNPTPSLASGNNRSRCGSGTVTLTANPGSNGNIVRWYSASSGGTLLHTGTSYTTPSLSSNRTYYAASYNSSTGCVDGDRKAITAVINTIPTFTFSSLPSVCVDDGSFNLQGYTSSATSFNGDGVSFETFNPTSAGIGTHTITASRTVNGCVYTQTKSIVVKPLPTFTFNDLPSVCIGGTNINLQDYSTATTTFSGAGVLSSSFNPDAAGVGTHVITASRTVNGCVYTQTKSIVVKPLPAFTFNNLPSVCISGTNINLQDYSTATTTFSGAGVSSGSFNPDAAGVGTHVITASRSVNGCVYTETKSIVVKPLPTFTFSSLPSVCIDDGSFNLQGYTSSATSFNGDGVSFETFNPTSAGVGTHTITAFRFVDGCSYTQSRTIVVRSLPTFTFEELPSVCLNETSFSLQAYTSVATSFSGAGVSSNSFNPDAAGVGTHVITASKSVNGCIYTQTKAITVEATPGIPSSQDQERFGSGTVTLNASPGNNGDEIRWYNVASGGTPIHSGTSYTTPNISANTTFYIASFNSLTGCEHPDRTAVLANVLPTPSITTSTNQIRPGQTTTLIATPGYPNYRWYRDNDVVQHGSNNQFEVSSPGNYKVQITSTLGATYTSDFSVISDQLKLLNENAVVAYTYRTPTTNSGDPFQLTKEQQTIEAQIYDGLGRPIQGITLQGSPTGFDVVSPIEYDGFGRQSKLYKPYVDDGLGTIRKSEALTKQINYYQAEYSTSKAYAETRYEPSPLNRPLEQGAPGDDWQVGGATVKYAYDIADDGEVIKWTFESMMSDSKDQYGDGKLYKTITTDEDGNQTIEYANTSGQTILKKSQVDGNTWAETYYIYDIYGNPSVVLPPEASARLDDEFFVLGANRDAFLNTWAYLYEYDNRNRMIMKKVPGADSVFMVYDPWDRMVLTQDGVQRETDQWLFTKYDALNRPVMTGLATIPGTTQQVRDEVSTLLPPERYETFVATGINQYSDVSYPQNSLIDEYLTVTYYDDYDFLSETGWLAAGLSFTNPTGLTENMAVKGLVTGTMTKAGDGSITTLAGGWIRSVSYYDDKYRLIQAQSTNHVGGKDVITNYPDFIGQIDKTIVEHSDGAETTTITRKYDYDHVGRLMKTFHQIDEEDEILLSSNEYNELGELTGKSLHTLVPPGGLQGGETYAQTLSFDYNIRGWLTSMNDPANLGDDLFGMKLHYNTNPINTGNTNFNGNISAMQWSDPTGSGANNTRAYDYGYDGLNRLTEADHFKNIGTPESAFDVSIPLYDLNGNIKQLSRNGDSGSVMDNLDYKYFGNQLLNVTEKTGGTSEGFSDGNDYFDETPDPLDPNNDYTYDENGNMISDANKGIISIGYNYLNLPTKVIFSVSGEDDRIEYLYDAAGIKLQQKVYEAGSLIKTTDYVGEFIYEDGALQLIQHEEGRIVPLAEDHPEREPGVKEYDYQYHLKDHLGNVRVTFSTTSEYFRMPASMEDANEAANFHNYQATSDAVAAHSGTHVFRNSNLTNDGLGMNTFLCVNKGDTIKTSAYAYYNDAGGSYNLAAGLISGALFGAYDPNKVVEGVTASQSNFNEAFLVGTALGDRSGTSEAPRAYINYIFFNTEMEYQQAGFKQITSASNGTSVQVVADDFIADQEGYLMVYLSNETQGTEVVVSWDDLEIYHGKTNVVSTQDYYPFGLTFNSYQRTASKAQNFLYNQGAGEKTFRTERVKELGLNWDMTKFRTYDYTIGRFLQVDPFADGAGQEVLTPYHYSFNNPILYNDPYGDCPRGDCWGALVSAVKEMYNDWTSAKQVTKETATTAVTEVSETIQSTTPVAEVTHSQSIESEIGFNKTEQTLSESKVTASTDGVTRTEYSNGKTTTSELKDGQFEVTGTENTGSKTKVTKNIERGIMKFGTGASRDRNGANPFAEGSVGKEISLDKTVSIGAKGTAKVDSKGMRIGGNVSMKSKELGVVEKISIFIGIDLTWGGKD